MRAFRLLNSTLKVTAAGLAALALAGCGGGAGSPAAGGGASDTLANILAFGRPSPPPAPAAADPNAIRLTCPEIEVPDGLAALRVGGQGGAVRYQYSLGDTARECSLADSRIAIRVGVEGRVLIGPAGSSGAFTVPVRIAVQRTSDQKAETTKVYRVAVAVPAGDTQGGFQLVTEPIYVPYKHEDATDDYTIVVGFDGARETGGAPVQRRRRR